MGTENFTFWKFRTILDAREFEQFHWKKAAKHSVYFLKLLHLVYVTKVAIFSILHLLIIFILRAICHASTNC